MKIDAATIKWLNLLHKSPSFVVRVGREEDCPTVVSVQLIPENDGEYWVSGSSILKCGDKLESIFRIDTDSGGSLIGGYWYFEGRWWDFQEKEGVLSAIKLSYEEIFPFDWCCNVAVKGDIYHG